MMMREGHEKLLPTKYFDGKKRGQGFAIMDYGHIEED